MVRRRDLIGWGALTATRAAAQPDARPNILFAISDDQSWLYAGAYGNRAVKTPAFDRIAREGVLFRHAYTAAPSCTPSRSAILTGQQIWRLKEAGVLFGTLPPEFDVFPLLLEDAGYHVGNTGKAWEPGEFDAAGRTRYPAGRRYNDRKHESPIKGISTNDYAANFGDFLSAKPTGQPFCFWYGALEPHRAYQEGAGAASGKKLKDVTPPPFLPDTEQVRSDLLDYCVEIEHFDSHLARMLKMLETRGELDRTIVIVTSDNGMPFPRGKSTLYDCGVRMPMAVRWHGTAAANRIVDDFVSLTDIAPTVLEAAGIAPPPAMTGRSLLGILKSTRQGQVDPTRNRVFTALERHACARHKGAPYPCRAIRTADYLYIRNFEPDRWPAGDPDFASPHNKSYGEIDTSPTKSLMMAKSTNKDVHRLFELAFGKRPAEELYDLRRDPWQMSNVANRSGYAAVRKRLSGELAAYLAEIGDPRSEGEAPWDGYRYYPGGGVVPRG